MQVMEPEPQRYRVLGSPSRSHLLAELRRASGPLDVRELAMRVGLHPNTAREHLAQLTVAGLVAREKAAPVGRGRPALLYRAEAPMPEDSHAHRGLARILADDLARRPDGRASAIRAGEQWGQAVASTLSPGPSRAVEQLVDLLGDLGFAPEHGGDATQIRLRRCPFGSLARERGEVVCGAHLGLMRGALRELAAPVDVLALEPFVAPSLCVARLGPARRPA